MHRFPASCSEPWRQVAPIVTARPYCFLLTAWAQRYWATTLLNYLNSIRWWPQRLLCPAFPSSNSPKSWRWGEDDQLPPPCDLAPLKHPVQYAHAIERKLTKHYRKVARYATRILEALRFCTTSFDRNCSWCCWYCCLKASTENSRCWQATYVVNATKSTTDSFRQNCFHSNGIAICLSTRCFEFWDKWQWHIHPEYCLRRSANCLTAKKNCCYRLAATAFDSQI